MLRGLSIQAAPLAMLGLLWPPFCDLPEWAGGGGGSGGADTGGAGGVGADAGEGGEAGSGGAEPEVGEPVLGCAAGEWPSQARFELLPALPFDDLVEEAGPWKLSADGEVVVTSYVADRYLADPDGHRPVFWKGGVWDWVDPETSGTPTAISCDGSVIVGRKSRFDGFIKKADTPLVVLPGEPPTWVAIPYATSADGAVTVGDLLHIYPAIPFGETRPVVWALDGEATFLETTELRSLRHVRYDGELLAGGLNYCYFGLGCPFLGGLFFTDVSLNETVYEETPWDIISSDFSTSTGHIAPPNYANGDLYEVALFRPPDDLTVMPCPASEQCSIPGISSRGNIVLVTDVSYTAPPVARVWTAGHGYRSLVDLLAVDGVLFQDFVFYPSDMSDDGRVILGWGSFTYENGEQEQGQFRLLLPRDFYE
ncbi:MAG: hypothetical protein M3020_08685 [Myxococcota bacterium]|nr:hypothetical protein [Myxococcota bacterium]